MAGDLGATLGAEGWTVPGTAGSTTNLQTAAEMGESLGGSGWSVPGAAGDVANLGTGGNINAQLTAQGWDVRFEPSPTFALDFARDQYSTLSPALTVSSPTGGVMVPDYLGNYHKTLADEIPIRGGRRLYNLLASTDTLATQGVTVEDADYWLSFKGTGSVAVTGVATDSLAGTGADDRVSKKVTMGSAGTATFTVTGSVTEAYLYKSRPGQTAPDPEYVSRGVLSSPYHGYGVDGLAWMRTDPSGLALADAESGHPVLCTGIADWPTLTNRLTYNQDASQWTERGAATITNADDGTIDGGYFEVRGLGDIGANDVYRVATGFTADADAGLAVLLRPVDTSGTLRIVNPADSNRGNWAVDVAALTPSVWNLVNRSHPAVTVTSEFSANGSGVAGVQLYRGATMTDIDMAVPTEINGTLYCPVVIPTAATAVTANAIVKTLDDSLIGWVAGGGTLIVEQTPEQDASTGDILIDIKTDADNRILVSGAGGNTQLLVRDGASDVATINGTGWQAGVTQRVAAKVEANDAELVIDGASEGTDTSLTVPAITTITLGGGQAKSIGAIAYYAAGA